MIEPGDGATVIDHDDRVDRSVHQGLELVSDHLQKYLSGCA
jgi:hypothetical protein